MDLQLAGKTTLITGGSQGIGRATAEIMAAEGCNLIIVARNAENLSAVKSAIARKGDVRVDTVIADLSDSEIVDRLARDYPDVDILVNNAGAIPGGSVLQVDETTWRKAWDLKVFGYINMCRAFYARMKERQRSVIINVVGNAADTHDAEYICGVAGNAALAAFSQSLGSVSAKDGIRVVALSPGPVATERLIGIFKKIVARPDWQRRQLAGFVEAPAVRARRNCRRDWCRDCVSRLRPFRLHQRIGVYHRCWNVRGSLHFVKEKRDKCHI
jgi:3-oxoacyl-[acyl-carrier protein] reductase